MPKPPRTLLSPVHRITRTVILTTLLCLVGFGESPALHAQTFDIAADISLPAKPFAGMPERKWTLPGYELDSTFLHFGIGTAGNGKRVYLHRYSETDQPIGRVTLQPERKSLEPHGAASLITPDARRYSGGAFLNGEPAGKWLRMSIDTTMSEACEGIHFEADPAQITTALRECFTDTASQRRVRLTRVAYKSGQLHGPAVETYLDGRVKRSGRYITGKPVGVEVDFSYDGDTLRTIAHGAARSDTVYHEHSATTSAIGGIMFSVERMPAFPSPTCPEPDYATATEEEVAAYQECTTTAMLKFIYHTIRYPLSSRMAGAEGMSVVQFVVEKDGSIGDVHTERFISSTLDAEALRIVKAMPPWHPGYQDGEPVRVQFNLPVVFRLE